MPLLWLTFKCGRLCLAFEWIQVMFDFSTELSLFFYYFFLKPSECQQCTHLFVETIYILLSECYAKVFLM